MAPASGNFDQRAEAIFGPHKNLGHDDPTPAHAIDTAQVVPNIGLGNGEEDIADELPASCAFGHGDIEECIRDVSDVFDHERVG